MHSYNGYPVNDSSAIEIGGCTVRPTRNLLERNGRSIKIVPRTMDTLIYLAEHAGEVVSAEELIGAVWRGRIVNDAQIYKSMSQLRQALGELREDVEFIQTVPKRGYRLVAPVTPARQHGTVSVAGDSGTVPGRKFGFAVGGILALTLAIIVGRSMEEDDPLTWAEASGAVFATPHFSIQASQPEHFANSVAVLPFENLSLNPEDAHFAAGVHEEILNHLTKIDDLRVVARASVLPYAGAAQPIFEIADELRVGTIMVGSVRYADDRVRIGTQHIDAESGSLLWSASYERELADIFAIQTDIATRVATALGARLSRTERKRIEERLTDSPEAYTLYLRAGTTDLSPGLPASLRHLYLDRAIALDPEFAHAYARKANAYSLALVDNVASGAADFTDLAELDRLTRQNAGQALALDPSLGSAYLALGRLHQFRWRWAEAQQAYERAFELGPNDLDLLRLYSQFNSHTGNHAKAIRLAERAMELAPAEPALNFRLGTVFLYAGSHDAAIAAFRETVELDPMYTIAHVSLAIMEGIHGNTAEAVTELRVAEICLGADPLLHLSALIAYGYAQIGRREDVARVLRELENRSAGKRIGAGREAFVSLALGDEEKTLKWLESVIDEIDTMEPDVSYYSLMLLTANAFSDPVLDEPQFQAVRDRIEARSGLQ